MGIVIRDMSGKVKVAASLKLQAMVSPLVAEVMAVWHGVILASKSGFVPFHVEYDSLQVVDLVNKGVPSADVSSAINLILEFLTACPDWCFHVPRTSNLVAHNLAKMVLSAVGDCCWLDSCPPCVERLVQLDASG
ncbi:hypothetical protein Ddye_011675 [Dipteronia dyeriana]|uniref:RNase H type-1 domain-containing protein n=1 Tax=Dipteronia dyeriana TaxID=168575 RepID=A0AAE0CHD2_9ROSI|nr:hypothetical protein Ddye_011675 [Dipteronia dyeriana]